MLSLRSSVQEKKSSIFHIADATNVNEPLTIEQAKISQNYLFAEKSRSLKGN